MKIFKLVKDFGIASKDDMLIYDEDTKSYVLSTLKTDESETQSSTKEVYMTLPVEVVENNPELFVQLGMKEEVKTSDNALYILQKVEERMENVAKSIETLQAAIPFVDEQSGKVIEDSIQSLQKEYWTLESVIKLA